MAKSYPRADQVDLGHYELSTHLLALEVMRRGHDVKWIHRSLFTTEVNGRKLGFWCTRSNAVSTVAAKAITRKDVARGFLESAGVAIAPGRAFKTASIDAGRRVARRLGYPLVVKPSDSTKGNGITVGVESDEDFAKAWQVAAETGTNHIVIERLFTGEEARFLVVGKRCVAVYGKKPPSVVGNGKDSIEELIAAKNRARESNPHLRNRPIKLTEHRIGWLARHGYSPDDIAPADTEIVLDLNSNLSSGADSVDLTDDVDPSYLMVALEAVAAFPGLGIAGVDMMAHDFRQPARSDNHIVLELNSMPAIGSHHFPGIGEPRDAARAIVDYVAHENGGQHSSDTRGSSTERGLLKRVRRTLKRL